MSAPDGWLDWLFYSFLAGFAFTAGAALFNGVIGLFRRGDRAP